MMNSEYFIDLVNQDICVYIGDQLLAQNRSQESAGSGRPNLAFGVVMDGMKAILLIQQIRWQGSQRKEQWL